MEPTARSTGPQSLAGLVAARRSLRAERGRLRLGCGVMTTGIQAKTLLGLSFIWVATACGSDRATGAWTGEVIDSAGVRIVVSSGPGTWGDEAPVVEEELRFGSLSGGGPDEFGSVVALDVDERGRIHVLDQQAQEVSVFDPAGGHVHTLGGPGGGPGELSAAVLGIFVAPDGTVQVPDVGNVRINRYRHDGVAIGSVPMSLEHGVPLRWDATAEGTLVAQLRRVPGTTTEAAEGMPAAGDAIVRVSESGSVIDTLGSIPGGATITAAADGVPRISLFVPEPLWDLSDTGALVTAVNAEYRVEVRAPDGTLTHVLVRPGQRRSVTEGEKGRLRRLVGEMLLDQGVPPTMAERITRETTFADSYPVLASVVAASGGDVWVQRVRGAEEMFGRGGDDFDLQDLGDRHWDVFDAEGRYRGALSLPDRFTLMKVAGDRIYGVARDSLDVQHVVRMRVRPR